MDLLQLAAGVGPAVRKYDRPADARGFGQSIVPGITINLERAAEARQKLFRMFAAAPVGIAEHNAGRSAATKRAFIPGDGPEIAGFGFSATRIENWTAGFVHKQLVGRFELLQHVIHHRPEMEGRSADPVRQRGTVQIQP